MDLKTTYEKLIAEKVQQLPIPDMADAIWASIELQLGADTSTDGEDNSPLQKPSGKGGTGFGNNLYFVITAAVIIACLVWLLTKKNKNTQVDEKLPDTIITKPPTVVTDSGASEIFTTPEKNKVNNLPALIPNNDKQTGFVDSIKTTVDSLNNIPPLVLPIKDTTTAISLPMIDSLTATPPGKKPKGVKGISDADYKIVTDKKDSVKKKD